MKKSKGQAKDDLQEHNYPLPINKYYFHDECLNAKKEDEPLLSQKMCYRGQYRDLREMAMRIMPAEWVAKMQDGDLCDAIQVLYAYAGSDENSETIVLIERAKADEYIKMRQAYETVLAR